MALTDKQIVAKIAAAIDPLNVRVVALEKKVNDLMASLVIRAQPPSSSASTVMSVLNATPLATVQSIGTIPTSYEAAFAFYADLHWNSFGAAVYGNGTNQGEKGGNYYDRAKMYYREWARTGTAAYKTRADAMVVDYINNHLAIIGYGWSFMPQWSLPIGLYLYDVVNGGTTGKTQIGLLADEMHDLWKNLVNTAPGSQNPNGDADTRIAARALQIFIWAKKADATSAVGANWDTDIAATLTGILARQSSDGAIRNYNGNYQNKAFMVGLWCDALIDYIEHVGADARIAPAIKLALDYLTSDHWVPQLGAFHYLDGHVANETYAGSNTGTVAAAELNQVMAGIYWWYFSVSADTTYRDKGDRAFIEGVNMNDWSNGIIGGKQFNEQYSFLPRYWAYRGTSPMANASINRISYPFDAITPNGAISNVTYTTTAPTDLGAATAEDGVRHAWRSTMGAGYTWGIVTHPWTNSIKGTIKLHAKKSASGGASTPGVYFTTWDDGSVDTVLATLATLPASAWGNAALTDTVLSLGGATSRIKIGIGGNGVGAQAGNIDLDGLYLGVGATEIVEPAVPVRTLDSEPVVTGTAQVGQTLTGTTGSWANSPSSYARQWLRNGVPIASATGTTYVPVSADIGKYLSVRVIASNAVGASTPIKSDVTAVVIA